MKILNSLDLVFDSNGHFYLDYDKKIYEFSIDNKNNLEIFEIRNNDNFKFEIETRKDILNISPLDLLTKSNTLKSKIIREYINEKEENSAPDEEYDDDHLDSNTIDDINNKMKYFPEDLEYLEDEYLEDERSGTNNDYETEFLFFGNISVKVLCEIDLSEINEDNGKYVNYGDNENLSSYDTFIYDRDIEHPELAFVSKLNNINSSYRLLVFKDGTIILRVIGGPKKIYKLKLDESNIILEST